MTIIAGCPPTGADTDVPDLAELVRLKSGRSIGVCIPARNEAATIGPIVGAVHDLLVTAGLVDDLVVVDDGSTDRTAPAARAAGARVVRREDAAPGKGEALRSAVAATDAEILVFVDADVTNFEAWFVAVLVEPLLRDPGTVLVKAAYERPLDGRPGEGGRVTELVARPLLERFFPALAGIAQPLAGEFALRRSAITGGVEFDGGYGVDIGVLIDMYRRFGRQAISEVDLRERVHRNRPLHELQPHCRAVIDAVLARAGL